MFAQVRPDGSSVSSISVAILLRNLLRKGTPDFKNYTKRAPFITYIASIAQADHYIK